MPRSLPCPRTYCGGTIDAVSDGNVSVGFVCRGCERNKNGMCRDCPAPVSGNRMRCERCSTTRNKARALARRAKQLRAPGRAKDAAVRARNARGLCAECPSPIPNCYARRCAVCARNRKRAIDRKYKRKKYRTDPAFRQQMLEAKHREYQRPEVALRVKIRNAQQPYRPRTEADRAYHRARRKVKFADPVYRAKVNARRRALYVQQREKHAERARERWRALRSNPEFRARENARRRLQRQQERAA